jgi:hypothetical protein
MTKYQPGYGGALPVATWSHRGERRDEHRFSCNKDASSLSHSAAKKKKKASLTYFSASSGIYSSKSPGVQFKALHIELSVEKRIARALLVFRTERLLRAMPVASASSVSFIRRSKST